MTTRIKKKAEKIISVVLSVLIAGMILLVGYLTYCNVTGNVAFIGHYSFVRILSPSMEPTIPTGQYILVRKVKPSAVKDLKTGDIIVFRSHDPAINGQLNTHRIVKATEKDGETEFVTKGDNNPVNDSLVTVSSDVVGTYVRNLSALTRVANLFMEKKIFFVLVIIPAFILLGICVYEVMKKSKEVKMELLVQEKLKEMKETDDPALKSGGDSEGGEQK